MTIFVRFLDDTRVMKIESDMINVMEDLDNCFEYEGENVFPLIVKTYNKDGDSKSLRGVSDLEVF